MFLSRQSYSRVFSRLSYLNVLQKTTIRTDGISGTAKTYNENSTDQLAVVNSMLPYIHLGVDQLDITPSSLPFIIADFGSSHGKNSIQAMKIIIEKLQQTNKLFTSPLVIHNDLPTNDWATFFQLLAKDNSYQGVANGRSFYEQCLPTNSLSIGFSSYSINWLSNIPCKVSNNRFYIYANENEREAFKNQAKLDWSSFIEHRSRELVSGGILVLCVPSFDDQTIEVLSLYFESLYPCAKLLFTEKELSDFAVPMYFRSLSECVDHDLFDRCSLQLIKAESLQAKPHLLEQCENGQITIDQFIKGSIEVVQTTIEKTLKQVLEINGRSKEAIDKLLIEFWILYEEKVRETSHVLFANTPYAYVCLILKKMHVAAK